MPFFIGFDLHSFLCGVLVTFLLLSFRGVPKSQGAASERWNLALMAGYLAMAAVVIYLIMVRDFAHLLAPVLAGLLFLRYYWQRKFATLEADEDY